MTRRRNVLPPSAVSDATVMRTLDAKLPSHESLEEWNARSTAASLQARELLDKRTALDQGEFCDWLEKQEIDVLAVRRLIDLAVEEGRSTATAEAANARWREENEAYVLEAREAWLINTKKEAPVKKAAFCEAWSLALEARGYQVDAVTIRTSWLRGMPSIKRPKTPVKKNGPYR